MADFTNLSRDSSGDLIIYDEVHDVRYAYSPDALRSYWAFDQSLRDGKFDESIRIPGGYREFAFHLNANAGDSRCRMATFDRTERLVKSTGKRLDLRELIGADAYRLKKRDMVEDDVEGMKSLVVATALRSERGKQIAMRRREEKREMEQMGGLPISVKGLPVREPIHVAKRKKRNAPAQADERDVHMRDDSNNPPEPAAVPPPIPKSPTAGPSTYVAKRIPAKPPVPPPSLKSLGKSKATEGTPGDDDEEGSGLEDYDPINK